ncbi:MAG: hypothetical protein DBY09_06890 [Selenomonadales bacterium]|nr:MAG: hypothetical protein DBY09_06890 [Selenomonadales bacterium]
MEHGAKRRPACGRPGPGADFFICRTEGAGPFYIKPTRPARSRGGEEKPGRAQGAAAERKDGR